MYAQVCKNKGHWESYQSIYLYLLYLGWSKEASKEYP